MAANPARGVTLDAWQRQAVLAAATLLRERFGTTPDDLKARSVHDGLLEVVEPVRRAIRLQREMATAAFASGAALTLKSERRARGRRSADRRVVNGGPPDGIERRIEERRGAPERRARR